MLQGEITMDCSVPFIQIFTDLVVCIWSTLLGAPTADMSTQTPSLSRHLPLSHSSLEKTMGPMSAETCFYYSSSSLEPIFSLLL